VVIIKPVIVMTGFFIFCQELKLIDKENRKYKAKNGVLKAMMPSKKA
jgi:hypothetical protein